MRIILLILATALILKDTAYLGDPYIMRGIAQGLCLVFGSLWLLKNTSHGLLQRYWPILGYIVVLLFSVIGAKDQIYVLLQVCSLIAVIIFFIAFYESQKNVDRNTNATLCNATVVLYALVAFLSLVFAIYYPLLAYDELFRFRGLFSESAMLGAASGLLIGMAWFGVTSRWIKTIAIIAGSLCLAMTLSRTFWIATLISGGLTAWLYYRKRRKWIIVTIAFGIFLILSSIALNIQFDTKKAKTIIRSESIINLSGRISLWETALKAISVHPILGYGFTEGGIALYRIERNFIKIKQNWKKSPREIGRTTLHNGYLQSLLDSGLIGTFFYLAIIVTALRRIYKFDKTKLFPLEFFSLHFLIIANFNENLIYSASVFHNILFWAFAVFALSLKRRTAFNQNV